LHGRAPAQDIVAWLEAPHESPPPVTSCQGRKIEISGKLPKQRIDDQIFEATANETIVIELEHEPVKILVPPKETTRQDRPPKEAERDR
jgi:hypothetical protein